MLSTKLQIALEALSVEDHDHSDQEPLGATHEELLDEATDGLVTVHLDALQDAHATLEALQLAQTYVQDGMSRDRYNAIKRVAGDVPALESWFAQTTEGMFTNNVTTIGHQASNESLVAAIGKGVKWLIDKIRALMALISKLFSEYIWSPTMADDRNIKQIEAVSHVMDKHTALLAAPAAHGTMAQSKAAEIDAAYIGRLNEFWNSLCRAHVTNRNLDTLTYGLYKSLSGTLQDFNAILLKVSEMDPSIVAASIRTMVERATQYEVREFIYAIEGRDLVVPEGIVESSAMLTEVVDKGFDTKVAFEGDVSRYHTTLTVRSAGYKTVMNDMRFAHRTFETLVAALLRRNDLDTDTLNAVSTMATTITAQINVARRVRGLHSRMIEEAAGYIKRRVDTVTGAVKAPGTPKELETAILSTR